MEWAPVVGQKSGGSFDHQAGVLLFELGWAEIAQSGM
ncbi:hypothetical protein SPHV1_640012 [Novosphingobium sp. KN65.2]|nr:hypothetical protein SPHV1_640012 [Novosphingobium sp. KN65.2]